MDIRRVGDYGIGTYVRNIVRQLARLDSKNSYLLIGHREHFEQFGALPGNFQLLEYFADPGSFQTHLHLPFVLRRHSVDLLHMPWFYAPAFVPARMVITVHDLVDLIYPPHPGPQVAQAARPWFARRALRKAGRVITVSQSTAREISRVFEIADSKISVLYDAVDEEFTSAPLPEDGDRIQERLAVNYPYVLYAGRVGPQKNLARLIEAFAVAKAELSGQREFADLKLVLIGDELGRHADLRRAVIRSRLRENFRFLGFVPLHVLRVFYSRAKAFLFPSLYEGFGLPPLEAMAHGAPVVASNVSSLPEILGDAALLVNPENVFEIARGIQRVLTDDSLRRDLIERGYDQVRRYSWERTARQLLEIYEETSKEGKTRGVSETPRS
ncbi:MAG TPA: glycosyltransferase family 1 protein [Candidatus Acidoferrales bacterium]|nr:glycosyltransferase family 1 protein [Candidatus Acidoferrales bacterium]